MSPAASSPAAPSEEASLARYLEDHVLHGFQRARTMEARMGVYLALNRVLRLEDTSGSVRLLQHHLPSLVGEILHDLDTATIEDVLHIALRTLSYLMYHTSLATRFADAQIVSVLTVLLRLLAATQNEATYKLCLWCLSMQNVTAAPRHEPLQHIVEALVHAIVNPFHSRAIELQALKGLHLTMHKHPAAMAALRPLWFAPMVSRLNSSDRATRVQVAQLLVAAATSNMFDDENGTDGGGAFDMSVALKDHALPAMQAHLTHDRHAEALVIWKAVLRLMRPLLARDFSLVNNLLYLPEMSMRHTDPAIRLLSLDAWPSLVGVFAHTDNSDWIFKKPVLVLLIRPILVCLAEETAINVIQAAWTAWRRIVCAVVEGFNSFCHAQESESSTAMLQQNAKKWKRWMEEVVQKVILAALDQEIKNAEVESKRVLYSRFVDGLLEVFRVQQQSEEGEIAACQPDSTTSSVITNDNSAGQSVQETSQRLLEVDLSDQEERSLLDDELNAARDGGGSESVPAQQASHIGYPVSEYVHPSMPVLGGSLLGLALILPDVLGLILKLVRRTDSIADGSRKSRLAKIVFSLWDGFCNRLNACSSPKTCQNEQTENTGTTTTRPPTSRKLRLRLLRLCIEFALGISTSTTSGNRGRIDSQAAVFTMQSLPLDSMGSDLTVNTGVTNSPFTVGHLGHFDFVWQLYLVHSVMDIKRTKSLFEDDDLFNVLVHPKSKIVAHLKQRIDLRVGQLSPYEETLQYWESGCGSPKPDSAAKGNVPLPSGIKFSERTNALPCILLYFLFEMNAALNGEQIFSGHGDQKRVMHLYSDIVDRLISSMCQQSSTSKLVMARFARFMEGSCRAANMILQENQDSAPNIADSIQDSCRLLEICQNLSTRSEDTQENASVLLQLLHSPVKDAQSANAPNTASNETDDNESKILPPLPLSQTEETGMVNSSNPSEGKKVDVPIGSEPRVESSPCMFENPGAHCLSAPITRPSMERLRDIPVSPDITPKKTLQANPQAPTMPHTPPPPQKSAIKKSPADSTPSKTGTKSFLDASSAPSTPTSTIVDSPATPILKSTDRSIFPDLAACAEPISQVFRHFPMAFRPFFKFYKIKTVGDLSAMSAEQVKTFGIRDPIGTVVNALQEFNARKVRMKALSTSPFRQRLQSPLTGANHPASTLSSPSPKRKLKQPVRTPPLPLQGGNPIESPQRKRARQLLRALNSELSSDTRESDNSGTESISSPKRAERVTFRLDASDGGTKFARPGEDSQEPHQSGGIKTLCHNNEIEDVDDGDTIEERFRAHSAKLLHHLRRSLHYADKLVSEEESLQSETMPNPYLQSNANKVNHVLTDINRAHELVNNVNMRLQTVAEASGRRCQNVLVKNKTTTKP